MSDAPWLTMYALPILLAMIGATPGYLAYRQARSAHAMAHVAVDAVKGVHAKVEEVEVTFNSQMDKASQVSAEAAYARGMIDGRTGAIAELSALALRKTLDAALRSEGAEAALRARNIPPVGDPTPP